MPLTDRIIAGGLRATVTAVRRCRKRVERVVREHRDLDPITLFRLIRQQLVQTEPLLARAIERSVLAAWISGAMGPAKEVLLEPVGELEPPSSPPRRAPWKPPPDPLAQPLPVRPPFGPLHLVSPGDEPDRPVRFPALESAARQLLAKQAMTQAQYEQLSEEAKHTGFSVASTLTQDATAHIQDAIAKSLTQGGGLAEFRKDVRAVVTAGGLTEPQVEQVFRTQTLLARSSGMRAVLNHPLVGDEFPYAEYNATHDARVRPEHLLMERCGIQGTAIYRTDDPILIRLWPPWAWSCRCVLRFMTIEDAAAAGIHEAREWLRTGEPPAVPAWVPDPGFQRPPGFPAVGGGITPAI